MNLWAEAKLDRSGSGKEGWDPESKEEEEEESECRKEGEEGR